ncbi:hypothetical protein ACEPAH_9567 [Sanghuangporus vaninii]
MSPKPGVYYLQNVMSGSMLTLNGDKKGVVGFAWYRGKDQKWELGKLGDHGWFIRSYYSDNNHYMTIDSGLGNDSSIATNEFPTAWDIKCEPKEGNDVISIHWPNTTFKVNLSQGSKNDGTKVIMWSRHEGRQQFWRMIRCPDEDQVNRVFLQSASRGTTKTTTTIVTITTTVVTKCNGEEDEDVTVVEKREHLQGADVTLKEYGPYSPQT